MKNTTEIQNRTVEKIKNELQKSQIAIFEDRIGLVENSKTDDIYRYLRSEKQLEIYIYEDGEANINGPLRKRVFERPDFDSVTEMEESILEEVILQTRPGEISGDLYRKLENRREKNRIFLTILLIIFGTIIFLLRSKN